MAPTPKRLRSEVWEDVLREKLALVRELRRYKFEDGSEDEDDATTFAAKEPFAWSSAVSEGRGPRKHESRRVELDEPGRATATARGWKRANGW
jgi:hypothetical protein